MTETISSNEGKVGLPPGTLIHVGESRADKVSMSVIDYTSDTHHEQSINDVTESFPYKETDTVTWVNINGLHDVPLISKLGEHYNLHPLLLEDALNTYQRPKMEQFDNCLFVVIKMLGVDQEGKNIVTEQMSLVLGDKWVISFQEQEGDVLDGLRERLRKKGGLARERGVDYLFYRLIDTIVDNYFFVIENISNAIEELEEEALNSPTEETLSKIQQLKKKLVNMRKSIYPLREVVLNLKNGESNLIRKETMRYLNDVYEHIIQLSDSIETHRDLLGSVMDLYLSGVSNKMNQVMKVLTIISTIFIPLTFIAGIYGMNFEYIPELKYRYAYHTTWGVMILVTIGMLIFFRRKKWL